MNIPKGQIADKVKSSALATLGFTIILGIVARSPLADNAWFAFTEDQAIVAAITSFISILFGYSREEKSFDSVIYVTPEDLNNTGKQIDETSSTENL